MNTKNIEDIYELTPLQQGILFHNLSAPDAGVYTEQLIFSLSGKLDIKIFQTAWQAVIDKHPIMRTSFHWKKLDKPLQTVHRQINLQINQEDWTHLSETEFDLALQTWLKKDRLSGFDFSRVPLTRITVFQASENKYKFVWCFPHLVMDGWSVGLALQDFVTAYQDAWHDRKSQLSSSRPYRDYLAWLKKQDPARVESYWRNTLGGYNAPGPLAFGPAPGPLPAGEATHEKQEIKLSSIAVELQAFARQHQITLNTMILASWSFLLSKYYGVDEVVVGATTANRPADIAGVGTIVGPMIITLPVRVKVAPDAQLVPWLKSVQSRQAEGRQYEWASLVQMHQWSDLPQAVPLVESILAFENVPFPELSLREEELDIVDFVYDGRPQYPISMVIFPGSDLPLRIVYDRRRFDDTAISRMLMHLKALLASMVAHPNGCLKDLSLVPPAEREQVSVASNQAIIDDAANVCVHQLFERQVDRDPDRIAIQFDQDALTYAELNRRSNQVANYLLDNGCTSKQLIGVYMDRSLEMVIGMLGILKAGCVYVPLDPAYPEARLSYIMEDTQLQLVLTQERLVSNLPDVRLRTICLDTSWPSIAVLNTDNLAAGVAAENLAYIIYTSGSTGKPKGALLEHRGLCNMSLAQIRAFDVGPDSRVLQVASAGFDASISEIFMALLSGARLELASQSALQVGPPLIHTLRERGITHVTLVPSVLSVLPEADLPELAVLISAGEVCSAEIVARWGAGRRFFNAYGPTEATVCATLCEILDPRQYAVIGKPISNITTYILDGWKNPVPIGITGELYIGGPGLARGYLGQAALTSERFIANPCDKNMQERLYKTGDLARYTSDGNIEFLGRNDNQVKIRGCRIELGEVEHALAGCARVGKAVTVVAANASGENQLMAYIVMLGKDAIAEEPLRNALKKRLPEYMVPSHFIFVDALPFLPSGKLDINALAKLDRIGPAHPEDQIAPRNPIESDLLLIWQSLLGVTSISIRDDFSSMGGNSLLALRLLGRIQSHFGHDIKLDDLLQASTIERQAELLRSDTVAVPLPTLVRIKSGARAPLFCLHPVGGSTLCYTEMAHLLHPDQPVYGIQFSGAASDTLQGVAAQYIRLLRSQQRKGPYFLAGWSTGATLALEMAQQLQAEGNEIGLLALIDPTFLAGPALRNDSDLSLLPVFLKLLTGHYNQDVNALSFGTPYQKASLRIADILVRAQELGWLSPEINLAHVEQRFDTFKATLLTHRNYVPAPFSNPAAIFVAQDSLNLAKKYRGKSEWRKLFPTTISSGKTAADDFLHVIPGNHYNMLTGENVETLARDLQACLDTVSGRAAPVQSTPKVTAAKLSSLTAVGV
jgi:amino acid adenylation domain-containing protein